jgi:hypothetical protein
VNVTTTTVSAAAYACLLAGVVLTAIPTAIDIRLCGTASDPFCSAAKVATLSSSEVPRLQSPNLNLNPGPFQ